MNNEYPNILVEAIMGREECVRSVAIQKIDGMSNADRLREYFAWTLGDSAWANDAIMIMALPEGK